MTNEYTLVLIKERYNPDHDMPRRGPPVPWYTFALVNVVERQAERIAELERQLEDLKYQVFEIMNPLA